MNVDPSNNLLMLQRFGYVVYRPQTQPFDFIHRLVESAHKNYRNVIRCFCCFQAAAGFKPIYPRHQYIQQNDIW
ncbi:hypothetical protein MiSe_31840 [Microseira wollei NIES-4236]|uniref:Uncharacterized protein n=1 Tax=Microseira wollei NIES-4236 TaxID=2530354 RepID=A0AAV3XCP5_9CYAN|nr:hypothetical protein MiSe_31840 [Microseira wollei NIES-4236]